MYFSVKLRTECQLPSTRPVAHEAHLTSNYEENSTISSSPEAPSPSSRNFNTFLSWLVLAHGPVSGGLSIITPAIRSHNTRPSGELADYGSFIPAIRSNNTRPSAELEDPVVHHPAWHIFCYLSTSIFETNTERCSNIRSDIHGNIPPTACCFCRLIWSQ